ncbi:MetQ/NlpA family ABC transporter substrate-binding protein [Rummeliibacillus sp. JY-2-4R]
MNKSKLLSVFILIMSLLLVACGTKTQSGSGNSTEDKTVTIGILDWKPYKEIVKVVQDNLKDDGIHLEIKYFSDVIIPNQALNNKEIDLNYFQHQSYLDGAIKGKGWNLVPVAKTFNNIFGAYSKKYKNIKELPDGAVITIPADPGNSGRSLVLLDRYGLIKLKDGVGAEATQKDIIENKHRYKIVEVEQMMLPKAYEDSDLTAIMGTYALQAGLTPAKDAIIKEKPDDYYTSIVVAREDNKDDEIIKKVAEEFESAEVKQFVLKNYSNVVTWPE